VDWSFPLNTPLDLSRDALRRLCGSVEQLASVTRFVFAEGKAKGVEALRVETGGGLSLTILIDRGLDLGEVRFRGQSLNWRSPAGVVHPAYYEREGSGWLRTFGGGLLVTCGLRNVGPGLVDGSETFGLHGEISCTPALQTNVDCRWQGERYVIEVRGEVREAHAFGPNLRLQRTWRTELGACWIELEDRVTNDGFRPEIHMQLYHWNFGYPLFRPASELYLSTDAVQPRDSASQAAIDRHRSGESPTARASEQVFFHRFRGEPPDRASVVLVSDHESKALGVELVYDPARLPHLVQWKVCGEGEYVCGIEPSTCLVAGREWHRQQGLSPLQPGETRCHTLRLTVLDGVPAVTEAIGRAARTQPLLIEPVWPSSI
jgi:hypothetical protein